MKFFSHPIVPYAKISGSAELLSGTTGYVSSPKWVCIPEITSDYEWFLWNTNSWGWTPFRLGAHNRFYFFHNAFFSSDNFTKISRITLKSSEITVRHQKSQLSVEEKKWVVTHLDYPVPERMSDVVADGTCVFSTVLKHRKRTGLGVTKTISCSVIFLIFQHRQNMLAIEYDVHIWQVSPQLSCGDTCQIRMWCKESTRYFCRIQKVCLRRN